MRIFLLVIFLLLCAVSAFGIYISQKNGIHVTLKDIAINAALVAGIITSLGVILSKAVIPASKAVGSHIKTVSTVMEELKCILVDHKGVNLGEMAGDLKAIKLELKPNGGSSLRDAVNRIEASGVLTERISWAIRRDGPDAIFRCNQDGENIEVNRTYCRWIGVGADELLGHGWRKFLSGGDRDAHYDAEWKAAFKHGREIEFQITLKNIDGEPLDFDVHAYPLVFKKDGTGEYLGVMKLVERA